MKPQHRYEQRMIRMSHLRRDLGKTLKGYPWHPMAFLVSSLPDFNLSMPTDKELKSAYVIASGIATSLHPEVSGRTPSEKYTNLKIQEVTKQTYWRSTWIGPHCFDFFFPYICGRPKNPNQELPLKKFCRGRGLVLEVDGSVHDTQQKMNKDEGKGEYLKRLGIMHSSVRNLEIDRYSLFATLQSYKHLPLLSSRCRARLLRKIYLETICQWLENDQFETLFRGKAQTLPTIYPAICNKNHPELLEPRANSTCSLTDRSVVKGLFEYNEEVP